MIETRPISGYLDYVVTNAGQVIRVTGGKGTQPGLVLRPRVWGKGYLGVHLYRRGDRRRFLVHRLVAAAFLGPCPEGHEVNHKDRDRSNNTATNLEYVTPSENQLHANRSGGGSAGERNARAKVTDAQVVAIRAAADTGEPHRSIALRFGISKTHAGQILRRQVRRSAR